MSVIRIQSLQRAIQLIDTLEEVGQPLSLRELSEKTSLPRSTTHRILSTLLDAGWVDQYSDGKYGLGLRIFELGTGVAKIMDIREIAKPYMQKISAEINESVSLSVLSRGEVLILSFVEAQSAFHVVSRVGARLPVHCTVQGKIMLAYMTKAEAKLILKGHGMEAYTLNTITSYDVLETDLEQIRKRGYAIEDSEFHVGLHSVAAPIYDEKGNVRYAFSVVSMFHKVFSPEFEKAKNLALAAAREISRKLGYKGDAFENIPI